MRNRDFRLTDEFKAVLEKEGDVSSQARTVPGLGGNGSCEAMKSVRHVASASPPRRRRCASPSASPLLMSAHHADLHAVAPCPRPSHRAAVQAESPGSRSRQRTRQRTRQRPSRRSHHRSTRPVRQRWRRPSPPRETKDQEAGRRGSRHRRSRRSWSGRRPRQRPSEEW